MTLSGGEFSSVASRGEWHMPFSKWWLNLPEKPTKLTFTLKQRVFGPMRSHTGQRIGPIGRLFYGWFYTDDQYFARVDAELKFKGM